MRRAAVAVALVALLAVWAVTAASLVGPPRNSIHAEGERGLSELAAELEGQGFRVARLASGPHGLDAFEEPGRTVLVVAGVERPYTPGELDALAGFVQRGGVAVVADDFGFGDRVGERFGVNVDNRVMRDATFHRNVSFPVVNATLDGQVVPLTLNVPTTLGFAPDVQPEVLARSSRDSYLDLDQDGVEAPDDVKGSFPVVAAVTLPGAAGKAVFVSDPGALANDLFPRNAPFHRALFRSLLPDGGTVVFDESRHAMGPGPALLGAVLAGEVQATSEPVLAVVVGLAGTALAVALWRAFRAPEQLGTHAGRLAEPLGRAAGTPVEERLRALAAALARDRHPGGASAAEAADHAELARHVGDPALAALLTGRPTKASPEELLRRIRAVEGARRRATPEAAPGEVPR